MRRLQIDEIVKQALERKSVGDEKGYKQNLELLGNICCSILSTIRPGEPQNMFKLEEIKFISDNIQRVKAA